MNIFFIRHAIDIDSVAPLILESDKAIVFSLDQFDAISQHPLYVDVRQQATVHDVSLKPPLETRLTVRVLRRLSKLTDVLWFSKVIEKITQRADKQIESKVSDLVSGEGFNSPCRLFFTFGQSELCEIIKRRLISTLIPRPEVLGIPHGVDSITNQLTRLRDTRMQSSGDETIKPYYDRVIVNDEMHEELVAKATGLDPSKILTIFPLRHTARYSRFINQGIQSKTRNETFPVQKKTTVLFLHTKLDANLFEAEVVRALKMLSNEPEIHLIFRPHPRGLREAEYLSKLASCDLEIDTGHVLDSLMRTDYVVGLPSTAFLDVFRMEKPLIFPRYITSSTLRSSFYEAVYVVKSPDELWRCIQIFRDHKDYVFPVRRKFRFPDDQTIVAEWSKLLNTGSRTTQT